MGLEQTISRIQKNMQHSSFVGNVLPQNRSILPNFLAMVDVHFTALENNEEVVATDGDIITAVRALDLCKMVVLEIPVTAELRELVQDVCILVFNWNNNTVNNESISNDVRFIRNAVEMHFTLIDLIAFTKSVVREATKKKLESSVRTDEISRHFLTAIDALNEKEECNCEEGFCSKS